MRERGLCENCIRTNDECWGKKIQRVANSPKKTPAEKHLEITSDREAARNDGCDRVNKGGLNPDYPEKELL